MPSNPHPFDPITTERLHRAAVIAAELVKRFGDDYWPVFERIDRELEQRQARKAKLSKFIEPL